MSDMNFADFIARERERLHGERETLFTQQQELENKITALNNELLAIEAYEFAKTGKAAPVTQSTRNRAAHDASIMFSPGRAQRGSRREGLLAMLRLHPDGLTRGEILHAMGYKGNKPMEMSVSNALTALTKSNQVSRDGGKYRTE